MAKQANGILSSGSQDKSLGDFEVVASIGKGSYGQMYKAIDRSKGNFKALIVIGWSTVIIAWIYSAMYRVCHECLDFM